MWWDVGNDFREKKAHQFRDSRASIPSFTGHDSEIYVDVVIENAAGNLACVEVKATATVKESDLRGPKKLAGIADDQFKMGGVRWHRDNAAR